MIKVVHVNYDGAKHGGASIAMFRIIEAQRLVGINSLVACRSQPEESSTYLFTPNMLSRGVEFFSKVMMKVKYGHCYSTGLINNGMADFVNSLQPDIVQLNWLQSNTIGIRELLKIKSPIVWFTHDLWPMSGVEPYPKCEWYKNGPPSGSWLNRRVWENKRDIVGMLKGRLYIVGPSEWARTQAKESIVFRETPCECIHYPVGEVLVKACRAFSGKPKPYNAKFTILFGATTGISAPIKGWDRLMASIDNLTDKERSVIRINVFGCEMPPQKMHGVDVEFFGKLSIEDLIPLYRSADLFALPSRQETWGQTKTESLCCGTPVIAFDQTACANGIRHRENGWIAAANDISGYTEGIRWFLLQWRKKSHLNIVDEIEKYRPETIATQWENLYKKIIIGSSMTIRKGCP